MNLRLDPTYVAREIENLKVLYPDIWDSPEDRALALGSETGLDELLGRLVHKILETRGRIEGTKLELADLKGRRERFEQRVDALRDLCLKLLDQCGVRKRELVRATIYTSTSVPGVKLIDESALPPDCIKTITTTKPDMAEIKDRLMRGEPVRGAELSNSPPVLNIRVTS